MCGHRSNRLCPILLFEIAIWAATTASVVARPRRHYVVMVRAVLCAGLSDRHTPCSCASPPRNSRRRSCLFSGGYRHFTQPLKRPSREVRNHVVGPFHYLFGLNLVNLLLFAAFVAAALTLRSRPDFHKRLMLMATLSMLAPAVARITLLFTHGPMAQFLAFDFCVLIFVATDTFRTSAFASGVRIRRDAPHRIIPSDGNRVRCEMVAAVCCTSILVNVDNFSYTRDSRCDLIV